MISRNTRSGGGFGAAMMLHSLLALGGGDCIPDDEDACCIQAGGAFSLVLGVGKGDLWRGGIPAGKAFGGGFAPGKAFKGGFAATTILHSLLALGGAGGTAARSNFLAVGGSFTLAATAANILSLSLTGSTAGAVLDAAGPPGSWEAATRLPSCPEDEAAPALTPLPPPLPCDGSNRQ